MRTKLLLLITCFLASCAHAGIVSQFSFQDCTIELLDSAGAAEATSHSDAYTKAQTTFDRQIRLGINQNVTEQDYLSFAAAQALTWTEADAGKLKQSFAEIEKSLAANNIHLNLPEKIGLLKTGGAEEFEAEGYTRENRIMLCIRPGQEINTRLVAHELFHVFSRFNPAVRDEIYAVFGFRKCNRINTAEAMDNRMITNPDCPFTEHYITRHIAGKDRNFVLQLYSKTPFQTPYDLRNANIALLELDDKDGEKVPMLKNGKGNILPIDEYPRVFAEIGANTPYVLHPEEISAEHFAMLLTGVLKSDEITRPELFEKMKTVLVKAK